MGEISLNSVFFNNTIREYLIALAILVTLVLVFYVVGKFTGRCLDRLSLRTKNPTVALLLRTYEKLIPILQYLPILIASNYLNLPEKAQKLVSFIGILIITVSVVRYLLDVVGAVMLEYSKKPGGNPMIVHGTKIIAGIVLWALAVLFILSNVGFNITTLITGLGIGGMAVALASQTLLSDLFNYFTIIIDRPFTIGDSVQVGGHSGKVEKIGLKGTRLLSVTGEQIVVSNTEMTKNVLKNYQIMDKRRVLTKLGLRYDTPYDLLKKIPETVEKIIRSVPETEFCRVHFYEFGDSSLNYEVVYFVLSKEYTIYMDVLQAVNFKIMEEFSKLGIEFAFPSQSIYMEK